MAIDGHRSNFPEALDDWGQAFENNTARRFRAEYLNRIADAVYQLQSWTRRILLTGRSNALRTDTGELRPRMLVKTFVVTVTGSAVETHTAALPAFSADELSFFGGTPLASSSSVHLDVRKVSTGVRDREAYRAALTAPIAPDGVDQTLTLAPLRDRTKDDNLKVEPGTYLVTLMLLR